jgi:preprotein translocase subunit YajC|tara:strand:- start:817 stop:1134 length:318 start_codon:yes stop_codon:yes gene_type:complete
LDILFAQGNGGAGSAIGGFLPFILIFVVIYFFMMRPQMKQQKQKKLMLETLKKGDRVITVGGIRGTIAGFKEKETVILLNVGKGTTLEVTRSSISDVVKKERNES